ncbi:uncharacterized protein LOC127258762 [Andrographis paniculata]|uniref:uncharacterized protein LOC127258762 n=1 Tax=Andrographis paniculata TaxID=175694 RepID=UPI0021E76B15|nr:uncharacterized protein LOC127258762 [Andrographis paniculata]
MRERERERRNWSKVVCMCMCVCVLFVYCFRENEEEESLILGISDNIGWEGIPFCSLITIVLMIACANKMNSNPNRRIEHRIRGDVRAIGRKHYINLVRLYSFCYDPFMTVLIYEFMENGPLEFRKDRQLGRNCTRLQLVQQGASPTCTRVSA